MKVTYKIFSFLLLGVFVYNIAGFLIVFNIEKHSAKAEMREAIEKDVALNIIDLTVTNASEITWTDDDEMEFTYKGNLYDLVKTSTDANGVIHYFCLNDQRETTLYVNADELVKRNMGGKDNDPSKSIYKLFMSLYSSTAKPSIVVFGEGSTVLFSYSNRLTSPVLDITSPPPKA